MSACVGPADWNLKTLRTAGSPGRCLFWALECLRWRAHSGLSPATPLHDTCFSTFAHCGSATGRRRPWRAERLESRGRSAESRARN